MITLFNFVSRNCPACGTRFYPNNGSSSKITDFESFQADTCPDCSLKYQLAEQRCILRAATASGGNLVDLMIDTSKNDDE